MDTVRFITKQLLKLSEQLVTYFNLIVKGKYPGPLYGVNGSRFRGRRKSERSCGQVQQKRGKGMSKLFNSNAIEDIDRVKEQWQEEVYQPAAGVEEGGRTGLSAIVVGLLFVLPLFFLPFFIAIPSNAIYPILIVIGVMMFSELRHIDYGDSAIKYSTFFILFGMPLTYSITNGLLLGSVVYAFVRIVNGEYRHIGIAMGVLALVALLVFFVL